MANAFLRKSLRGYAIKYFTVSKTMVSIIRYESVWKWSGCDPLMLKDVVMPDYIPGDG